MRWLSWSNQWVLNEYEGDEMFNKRMAIISGTLLFAVLLFSLVSCRERAEEVALGADVIGKSAVCPVTGDTFTIHESTPVVVYRGEAYYMCCPGCDTEFMKDPEKYIGNVLQKGQSTKTGTTEESEVEYWTCSMHPEVRSDKEGNCPICGMTLIPVYVRAESENSLNLTDNAMALAGIRMLPVKREYLHREIRLVGLVAYDPELVTAQEEYINALEMKQGIEGSDKIAQERAEQLVGFAEYRLRLLGMDEAEIRALAMERERQLSLVIPQNESWVYAEVYESDVEWIDRGQAAIITSSACPGEEFIGKVVSVSPTLDPKTRSVPIRIRLTNPESRLKPGMYVETRIMTPIYGSRTNSKNSPSLSVPVEAVLDTGDRKIVWVYVGDGNFQPRTVKVGPEGHVHGDDAGVRYYPVVEGLQENELVVTNGNFLIDSESRITGVAAIGYGGALGVEEPETQIHQH
jgi:Cu(I)/Ag(I) efflux system membrane fusion protein